jgi:peptidoglycan/LPS O-acetylase OafA/YrhL
MMEHIMPDIPRIYTAVAEWMACMLFILPVKKRFQKWQTAGIMAAVLLIQSVFLVMTDDIKIYFWIPCMIVAVFLMIVFIYSCCEIHPKHAPTAKPARTAPIPIPWHEKAGHSPCRQ